MRNPDNLNALTRAKALQLSVHESPFRRRSRSAPGLSGELFRSIGSVVWNLAEGAACDDPAFSRHLVIAIGSANEAEQQLFLQTLATSWACKAAGISKRSSRSEK